MKSVEFAWNVEWKLRSVGGIVVETDHWSAGWFCFGSGSRWNERKKRADAAKIVWNGALGTLFRLGLQKEEERSGRNPSGKRIRPCSTPLIASFRNVVHSWPKVGNASSRPEEGGFCFDFFVREIWRIFRMEIGRKMVPFQQWNVTVLFTWCQPIYTKFGTLMDTDVLHVLVKFECYTPLRCGAVNFWMNRVASLIHSSVSKIIYLKLTIGHGLLNFAGFFTHVTGHTSLKFQ